MVSVTNKVAKLEKDIIEFKASQAIGTGSSILPFKYKVQMTFNFKIRSGIVFIFRGQQANPVIMSKVSVLIDGQEPGIDGDLQSTQFLASVSYEPREWTLGYYAYTGNALNVTEYVAGCDYDLWNNIGSSTHTAVLDGYIWTSCEGDFEIVPGSE